MASLFEAELGSQLIDVNLASEMLLRTIWHHYMFDESKNILLL